MRNPDKTNKPAIAYVVLDVYPCATGGLETFYANHLKEISAHVNLYLITTCKEIRPINCNVVVIPKRFFGLKGTGRLAKLFFTGWQILKIKKKIKYVHLPYTGNAGNWGYVLPLLKFLFGIKYLLYVHGGGMHEWKQFKPDRLLFKYANKIAAVSEVIKQEYERRTRKSVEVVYPLTAFNTDESSKSDLRKEMNLNLDAKIILYVGSLKPLKKPDTLLLAFMQLGKDFVKQHNLNLLFIGDGYLKQELEQMTTEHDISNHVIFKGKIPNENVYKFYKIADYYVISSKFEGTPISLIEAMYNNFPIIGSSVSGIKNILKHNNNGLLFECGKVKELKKLIQNLIENDDVAERLARNAGKTYLNTFKKNMATDKLISINL